MLALLGGATIVVVSRLRQSLLLCMYGPAVPYTHTHTHTNTHTHTHHRFKIKLPNADQAHHKISVNHYE